MNREKAEKIVKLCNAIDETEKKQDELINIKRFVRGDVLNQERYRLILKYIDKNPNVLDFFIPAFDSTIDKEMEKIERELKLLKSELESY